MRMTQVTTLVVASLATALCLAADDTSRPQWNEFEKNAEVAVFGHVENVGIYGISGSAVSLAKAVDAAKVRSGKDVVVILRRSMGQGVKTIEIRADRLKEDGDIPLQANDVVYVVPPKAG